MRAIAEWSLRGILAVVFVAHGLGKFTSTVAFVEKFDVPLWQALVLGSGELAAALGMIIGGIVVNAVGRIVTSLSALSITISQLLAIGYVAWPKWLFYAGGMEFNVTLIIMAVAVVMLYESRTQ